MKIKKSTLFFYLIFILGSTLSFGSLLADDMKYKKPSEEQIKAKLTPLQYDVTQNSGTEPPFQNEYADNHEAGIYVDRVSGEPLFTSLDKYESGTGWPSFTKPISDENIILKSDSKLLLFKRTEVRSKIADSHLGHVFDDGPAPTGKRYCMNSAALRFIPLSRLKQDGYAQYLPLFAAKQTTELATFAGGCFWCMQDPFDELPGVLTTTVGYTGGTKLDPTYQEVSAGATGHAESIQLKFDPSKISYEKLLEVFWKNIDPLDPSGQFCDKGNQYRSQIFYHNDAQRDLAKKSLEKIKSKLGKGVVTGLSAASAFYPAENYHQSYYKKNPIRYKYYRWGCKRGARLNELKKLLGH